MTRTLTIIGACFTALSLIAIAHLFEPGVREIETSPTVAAPLPSVDTTEPPTVDEVLQALSPGVEEGPLENRLTALQELIEEIKSPAFASDPLSDESAERLVSAVEGLLVWPPDEELPKGITAAVGVIASRTSSPASKAFVSRILVEGSESLRTAVLRGVGRRGGIRGSELYDLVLALTEKEVLPQKDLAQALRRLGGRKSYEPIWELMRGSDDPQVVAHCAVALQDFHKPEIMGPILERLDEAGILGERAFMPWLDRKAFGEFIRGSEGEDLIRGLRAVATRPSLIKGNLGIVERELAHADPAVRHMAASAIRKAVAGRYVSARIGEELLAGRLELETEPVLRAELTGGIKLAREFLSSEGTPLQP